MTVLSVDLASRRYRDNGIAILRDADGAGVRTEVIAPASLGHVDPPQPDAFARALHRIAEAHDARVILLDGPQGWRAERSPLAHLRHCERASHTPGKTGLPGLVKPASWTRMALFSVALFDALASLGWPRINASWSGERAAIESFPTLAWRTLGFPSLPSRAKTLSIEPWRERLLQLGVHDVPRAATHDELQAIVAGLAGVQLLRGGWSAVDRRGCDPLDEGGHWREGWILSPLGRV